MTYPFVILKPGKDIPLRAGHPWVFSEAIDTRATGPLKLEIGTLVEVKDAKQHSLGLGTWNEQTSIRVRMFGVPTTTKINADFFKQKFLALTAWKQRHLPPQTNGYRLVHAEADNLPGLIIDRYDDIFVFQIHTAGMDHLRADIIDGLKNAFDPKAIIERSDLDVRRIEGLKDAPITIHLNTIIGQPANQLLASFTEYGLKFSADVLHGQKTGFFLDQRETRHAVHTLAKQRRVLNLFGYTGAFSIHAATGKANFVATVDISRRALQTAEQQFALNNLDPHDESKYLFLEADIFDLLNESELPGGPYDFIICDPPALAKSSKHLPQALRAYTDLNKACFNHLQPGGILVTSSCSGRLEPEDFRTMLRIAAGHAKREVRLLDWITQPIDHAERLAFPEGRYLKTAILEVTDVLK